MIVLFFVFGLLAIAAGMVTKWIISWLGIRSQLPASVAALIYVVSWVEMLSASGMTFSGRWDYLRLIAMGWALVVLLFIDVNRWRPDPSAD